MTPKVKPLVWEESVVGRYIGLPPGEKLGDLAYWVFLSGDRYHRHTKIMRIEYQTLELAQAAAQADYDARIIAALDPAWLAGIEAQVKATMDALEAIARCGDDMLVEGHVMGELRRANKIAQDALATYRAAKGASYE